MMMPESQPCSYSGATLQYSSAACLPCMRKLHMSGAALHQLTEA